MNRIPEIAKILRSTEKMASSFVKSVQDKVGTGASEEIILVALGRLSPRSIEINRVVLAVRKELAKKPRRPRKQSSKPVIITPKGVTASTPKSAVESQQAPASKRAAPKSLLGQLEEILIENWRRAEQEGFSPEQMAVPDFVRAVHRYCDPRDATRSRIVRACKAVDKQDVIITPPTVADLIRKAS